ncbi:AAA family ATPase [Brevundimonas lenta]|uniref:Putative ATPase n=1 Tax=Brevundimonas lenta TaxID=424796 RepID=A0A7W6JE23_9CAUL|nr:AAA family ATPase [Brevundimonas lenta]MBB4083423.1 putative ATPase [Brevundimonas lenta]
MMAALDRPYWIEARLERREGWDDDAYPFNLPVVRTTDVLSFHPRVTFLVGENGSGKSTLVEALAVAWGFNAEGGSRNFGFSTRGSHSPLHRFVRPVRAAHRPNDGFFLRAESYFNVASEIERLDEEPGGGPPVIHSYGGKSLHEQSHGESFFALFSHRFRGGGLYILDEPEAALSPSRQLSFLARLHDLVRQGSQFIIATHSPILLGYPDAWIYQASRHGLERVAWEDTEHYQVTKGFLNRPATYLDVLLNPE